MRISTIKFSGLVAVALLLIVCCATSQATTIDATTNNPLLFSWDFNPPDPFPSADHLTGNGSMTVSGFETEDLLVTVTLNNTSPLSSYRLTSFGFGIDPDAILASFSDISDGGLIDASLASIPSLTSIEVCAYSNNCSGGGSGGIAGISGTDTFGIILKKGTVTKGHGKDPDVYTFSDWGTSVNIAPIGFKYQTGAGSFEFTTSSSSGTGSSGTSSSGTGSSGTTVPEPASGTLALIGLALMGAGFGFRRRFHRS